LALGAAPVLDVADAQLFTQGVEERRSFVLDLDRPPVEIERDRQLS
jgi:hypothetical protein